MCRNAGLVLAAVGWVALATGCGDDDPKIKTDQGVDLRIVPLDSGDSSTKDNTAGDTQQDTGKPTPGGFGDECKTGGCATGFTCAITQTGATRGFCSKLCPKALDPCTGIPAGTKAFCLLSDGKGNNYCVFLCKYKDSSGDQTAPCPTQLTCGTKEDPAGSGQYQCIPK